MKVLVFDTETTGLPQKTEEGYSPSIYKTNLWPHIIQLSYILYDTEKHTILVNHDHIIALSPMVDISEKSVEIHGITREMSERDGIHIKEALELFNICMIQSDMVIAHNISFDKQVIIVECIRNRIQGQFKVKEPSQFYCTMKNSVELCKIVAISKKNNEEYFKYPTLTELHYHLFGTHANNTHDALVDIMICLRCFLKIYQNEDICSTCKKFGSQFKRLTK